ncbi:toxin [Pseudomonas syringae]|nr:toxin [Pseudomonas syringae]
MADQDLSITTPSIAKSASIATIGKSWGAVGPTGAAGLDLPIPASPGRGWDPQLLLSYSSQSGNGEFGVGWHMTASRISRRLNKGVPRYTDKDEIIGPDGEVWIADHHDDGTPVSRYESTYNGQPVGPHEVVIYRDRIKKDVAQERWQPVGTSKEPTAPAFWLMHGSDGSLHAYGMTPDARIADPDDPDRVSAWLLCESLNSHGEHICFDYRNDALEPDPSSDYRAQRYLRTVLYGNVTASQHLYAWTQKNPVSRGWHFHLVFDYGERTTALTEKPEYVIDATQLPVIRADPFQTFGQGYEIGSRLLCRQVLMFHHFAAELGPDPVLVRRLLLEYTDAATQWTFSQLTAAHYQAWDASGGVENTPPLEFDYSRFRINTTPARLLEPDNMPGVEDHRGYQCVDLFGEGLPGFLWRHDQSVFYREPQRGASGPESIEYGPWTALERIPAARNNAPAIQWLTDLTGNGRLDWVIARPGLSGFYTLNADRSWKAFAPFTAFPLELLHTLAQLGDFVGDGLSSIGLIGPTSVRIYPNQREDGFAPAEQVLHEPQDDRLPLFSATPTELVFLGNLLASDMPELCRIRHNEIMCWANLGHGTFDKGRRLNGPQFSYEEFDASRIRIADLNGSGAPALIYLRAQGFDIYLNRGGHGLEEHPVSVPWPAGVRYDRLCQVTLADLQGLGCASLILTVPHMTPQHWRYDFVDAKPYLLTSSNNNMGSSTAVVYRSSAQEWLDEKQQRLAQDPNVMPACHLPFPVQVVKRQQQLDEVTGNCLTQCFDYREGAYDSQEREFRGFGQLQQRDSESAASDDDVSFTAPTRLRTWFHNGHAMNRSRQDYFALDTQAIALKPTLFSRYHTDDDCEEILPPPDAATEYQIARSLVGRVARTETYAADDDPATALPYAVEEYRYLVREVRPADRYGAAVLMPLTVEKISYGYDRFIDDPMCAHDLTLCWNGAGMPTRAQTINYARRLTAQNPPQFTDPDEQQWWLDAHDEAQQLYYLKESRARFIDLTTDLQHWRTGLAFQIRANAMVLPKGTLPQGLSPEQICYEQITLHQDSAHWKAQSVLTGQSVQRYLKTSDGSVLPDGQADFEALAGPLEVAQLDKTALDAYAILPPPFDIRVELANIGYTPMPLLFEDAPYAETDENLWSSRYGYAQYEDLGGFYKVRNVRQTLSHGQTKAEHDDYHLTIKSIELPDGCTTRIEYDYHAQQPMRIVDANENIEEAVYESSGQPLASSFHGTENGLPAGFAALDQFVRPLDPRPDAAIADPVAAVQHAANTSRKDLFSWMGQLPLAINPEQREAWIDAGLVLRGGYIRHRARGLQQSTALSRDEQALCELIATVHREPVHTVILSADRYPDDPVAAQIQIAKVCVDGFGRTLQTQQLVEPGMAYAVAADGSLIVENGQFVEVFADPRWRISERVEYNNKGLAVRQFRPFFANTHHYVNDASLRDLGYFDQLFHDVLGRPIKLINAKGYFSRETYHPWYQISEDFNDTDEPSSPPPKRTQR